MMSLLQSRSIRKTGRRVAVDLQKAERAFKDGHLREVEQLCGEIIEESPANCQARLLLAELCFREQRFAEAETWIERAREIEPANPRGLNLLGRLLLRAEDLPAAAAAFRAAVEGAPDYADALANLGHVLLRTGQGEEAERYFLQAIEHDQEHGLANLSLGGMYYERQDPARAVHYLQAGIQRELSHREGQHTLAVSLLELGRFDESITAFRRLVAAGDEDPSVYCGLARALAAMGDLEQVLAAYEAALEFDPGHAEAAAGLAEVLLQLGQGPAALAFIRPRGEVRAAGPDLQVACARALQANGRQAEAILQLAALVKRGPPTAELAPAHRLLGQLLDDRGEYARAFAQHHQAHHLSPARFDAAAHEALVQRLVDTCDRDLLDSLPRGSASRVPVFVIGLPCSGTGRVARLIAGHEHAASAGALPHIDLGAGRLERYNSARLAYPDCLRQMSERELRELAAAHLARLFVAGEGARRIVDSMWLNFLHVGLIELMFPHARVIHCRRDPLDVGLGCYFRSFAGLPARFSGRQEDFGAFHASYVRLMAHWHATSRLPLLEVDYDAVCRDPASEGRRIMEFLELDPARLGEPVPDRGAEPEGRPGWHRDYAPWLEPLRRSLAAAANQPA